MPPKMKTPAPIDRPLSRAYLREFTGWSTAYPPGQSEPTSLRLMENMFVDRNGALAVRPGLRYLSYTTSPDTDPIEPNVPGIALDRPLVGSQEPFYVVSGDTAQKALLFAVREADKTVGWRAILFTASGTVVHRLTDPEIGFTIPQGEASLNFSENTKHVEYLQIDNKIIALSDAGEPMRLFYVGAEKEARQINTITMPQWEDTHKLRAVHPDKAWIDSQTVTTRRNEILNPSFEVGSTYWTPENLSWQRVTTSPVSGTYRLELRSEPTRTNLQTSPLHNVPATGLSGWTNNPDVGNAKLSSDGTYMKVLDSAGAGLFMAYGAKLTHGVLEKRKYRLAFDMAISTNCDPIATLTFYNASGAKIGNSAVFEVPENGILRKVSPAFTAPTGAVSMRVGVGGRNEHATTAYVKVKNVLVCEDGESTDMFHGSSGTYYFWIGDGNKSPSVYHPPLNISITSAKVPIPGGQAFNASMTVSSSVAKPYTLTSRTYNKDAILLNSYPASGNTPAAAAKVRINTGTASTSSNATSADVKLAITSVERGETIQVDAVMLEPLVSTPPGVYFDGSTTPPANSKNEWGDKTKAHLTFSVQITQTSAPTIPTAETPTAKTLIALGGAAANPYHMAFFYTFENEVGESAPSKVYEVRVSRPWSNWVWETPNANGEPSGIATDVATLCADQLAVIMPQAVFDRAVVEGALRWNLYAMTWSDQDPVPVVADLVATRELYADETASTRAAVPSYVDLGWVAITPSRRASFITLPIPTLLNRVNYSRPPGARNGLVAGDRLIVVGDPAELATIRWTSNVAGAYTNFTAARGGGAKTLTSGNLNLPACVALWQNPQSVDTLTVLCLGADGQSVSYYMMPATVQAQAGNTAAMGFEETTSTPGSVSPYAAEVLNNALYRPLDRGLLKSTAQNYNISHKMMTDKIANVWWRLNAKALMMSAQLDNRLYFLVHNLQGEVLEANNRGNEIWVYDTSGGEAGHWARLLIQGSALRVFSIGDREYMGIARADGLYYMDPDALRDDYVITDPLDPEYLQVKERPIPWMFETNTQGANRAHDAWAHLQQIQITLGDFQGAMRYGLRGHDVHHQDVHYEKIVTDERLPMEDGYRWDIDDILQIRRDMKEWYLFGSSIDGKPGTGQIGYVQYRYTPVSVNVGYEYGSVETFEYGSNVASGPTSYTDNGIPVPVMDYSRP